MLNSKQKKCIELLVAGAGERKRTLFPAPFPLWVARRWQIPHISPAEHLENADFKPFSGMIFPQQIDMDILKSSLQKQGR